MFRRKPTRIELKVEDLQEYESLKKETELKNTSICKDSERPESAESSKNMQSVSYPAAKMAKKLYDLCLALTTELLKNTYWNVNCDTKDNPFALIPSSIIDEIIVRVVHSKSTKPLSCSDLHLLLISGRVRNFRLEEVSLISEDLECILTDLSTSCANLISIRIKNVFCDHSFRMNLKTYALEGLLFRAPKLEYVESCIEFDLTVLHNCFNLKTLVLNFPVENHLFDFLEVEGQLMPHNSLRVLELYEDVRNSISYLDVAVILRYCPELVEINCDVGKSLEYLHTEKLYNGTLATCYKLQKCCLGSIYLDAKDAAVSVDGVYIASLTCPDLKEVDVLVKDYHAIHALKGFRNIRSLLLQWEIMQGGEYFLGIQPLLEKTEFGHNLQSLHIMHFSGVDFSSIGACCPNLTELRVEFGTETNRSVFLPTSFQNLVNLHVENIYEENCHDTSLIGLLSNATNLKHLTVLPAGMFTDSVLETIFRTNQLTKVRELRLSDCTLSLYGLQKLAATLTDLEFFEVSTLDLDLDVVAMALHEINPRIILSSNINDL